MDKKAKELFLLEDEIKAKKQALANTDYKCLKFFEGELTETEYAPIKEERRKLRVEINELEMKMNEAARL